ncbi:MAG: PepSY-associated TM helix domain-containing protein [Rubrivivax sp.]
MPSDGRRAAARALWLKLHRWFGLSAGLVLALIGTLGATLIVARPLDERLHAELFRARPELAAPGPELPGAPLESARRRLLAEFGPQAAVSLRLPREAGQTLQARVSGPWTGTVYLHPHSVREQGRRGDAEGFVDFVFKLHSSLLLQDTGKALLACLAAGYGLMLVTGIVLWWPRRWRLAFRIERRAGTLRLVYDLHRVAGATLGLWIAVSVASGAYMAYRPIGGWISAALGAKPAPAPVLPKTAPPTPAGGAPTLDALLATAQQQLPGAAVFAVPVPTAAAKPVRIRFRVADEPHPNGISTVTLDPRDGRVLAVQRWEAIDTGARLVAWVYPLHTGEIGGPALEALNGAGGLTLGLLGAAGAWLWWRRRGGAPRRAAAAPPGPAPRSRSLT